MAVMQAALYDRYGGADVLYQGAIALPERKPGEVLVRVHATSVNTIDTMLRTGKLRLVSGQHFPRGTGLDFAGEVVETDESDAGSPRVGDCVWGVLAERPQSQVGSAAEYVAVAADRISRVPANIDLVRAAALPGVGSTAIIALRDKVAIQPGERLLVRGASGGVGSIVVQLGRHFGAHVTALCGGRHLEFAREIGADEVFDYALTTAKDLGTFDVIIDTVGTNMGTYRRLLSAQGRMVTVSFGSIGAILRIGGSAVFGPKRIRAFSASPDRELLTVLAQHVEAEHIQPIIDSIYPLADISAAHRSLEKGGGRGKRVVTVAPAAPA